MIDDEKQVVIARLKAMTFEGVGPTAIARAFNLEGIPSPAGSTWYASSVASVLATATRA